MPDISFQEQCALGEKGDPFYLEGRFAEARDAYLDLLQKIGQGRVFDTFIASKIVLGLLLTYIKMNDLEKAHKLWTSGAEDYPEGIGILGLENQQTSVKDFIVYLFVCAFLHSMSTGDSLEAATAVNDYMQRICKYAREEDPQLLPMAINNWKQHLHEIYGTAVPLEMAE